MMDEARILTIITIVERQQRVMTRGARVEIRRAKVDRDRQEQQVSEGGDRQATERTVAYGQMKLASKREVRVAMEGSKSGGRAGALYRRLFVY